MNAIIIDDDDTARNTLRTCLQVVTPDMKILGEADNIDKGLRLIQEKEPKYLFLDIEMPGGNSFDLLDKIDFRKYIIIFVTGYDKYAKQAIQYSAKGYVSKPVDFNTLREAIKDAQLYQAYRSEPEFETAFQEMLSYYREGILPTILSVNHEKGITYIPLIDIIRIKVKGNCSLIKMRDKSSVTAIKPLKDFDERLKLHPHFLRISNNEIINLKEILTLSGKTLQLKNGEEATVSKRKVSVIKQRMMLFSV